MSLSSNQILKDLMSVSPVDEVPQSRSKILHGNHKTEHLPSERFFFDSYKNAMSAIKSDDIKETKSEMLERLRCREPRLQ